MAHSLTLDPAPRTEQQLRDAESEFMQALAPKTAAVLETNEKDTHKDKAVVYKDPPDHPSRTSSNALHPSDAYADLYDDTLNGVVDRSFSGADAAKQTAQRIIAENLAHGASGEFSTRSFLLRPKAKEKLSHAQAPTLSEQLRNVLK